MWKGYSMRAGLLTEVVDILRATISKNSFGEDVETWSVVYSTRARVEHVSSQLTTENSEAVYNFQKKITLRIYVPVREFDRIRWDGKEYRIVQLEKDKKQMQITIIADLINI